MAVSGTSSSQPPIQLSGLISGMDTQGVINQLMALAAAPQNADRRKIAQNDAKNAAFQAINTRVSALQVKASSLTMDSNLKAMLATSTDDTAVSATAGASAAPGTYKVTVNQLATATKASSTAQLGQAISNLTQGVTTANTASPVTAGTFTLMVSETSGQTNPYTITLNSGDTWGDVFNNISTATAGEVQASLSGNKLVLTTDPTRVTGLASGRVDDTSNFLQQTHLDTAVFNSKTNTATSSQIVGVASVSNPLQSAGLATSLNANNGDFKINGVDFTWDATQDNINSILTKINTSSAGVTATYSTSDDKLIITSKKTGSANIDLQDVSGNLLQALNLSQGSQQPGLNASITVDGFNVDPSTNQAMPIFSGTNDFGSVVPGLDITAKKVGAAQYITVDRDKDTLVKAVKDFITEFNNTVDAIDSTTAKDQPNAFDPDLGSLRDRLFSIVGSPVNGISDSPNTLMAIGIGTTQNDKNHLSLDEPTFRSAVDANRDRVAAIFQAQAPNPANPTQPINQGVAAVLNGYLQDVGSSTGMFKLRQTLTDDMDKSWNTDIANIQMQIDAQRQTMQNQFTQMEIAMAKMKNQAGAFFSQMSGSATSSTGAAG